jgi:hypothetical protein
MIAYSEPNPRLHRFDPVAVKSACLPNRYASTSRPWLRAVYERSNFRHHSDRQVGPYFVARYELALT